ncbi:hypothetical protein RhiXN_00438 [Rhizoctonia solani]|uniref:Uncharacterized protein n=1 Tax=Rhizoctonia solani TaxID=456999 RepID=A0A8H7H8E0_9AGAM|nr:uncharacterized protein RhiXN_00438 [Rhizoctonia solani]KAF8680117.1 hypothetical protein RHS04_04553 [Rhizoctonia solani]QRW19032.1 hypothetical protein RhiXN_00438 [Rhizoctonia solani]
MQPNTVVGGSTYPRVRPPPSHIQASYPSSLRRVMSEMHPVIRPPVSSVPPVPQLPQAILDSRGKENEFKPRVSKSRDSELMAFNIPYVPESRRRKYGYELPPHPRDAILQGKTLRHAPDSRRLNTRRDIDRQTVEMMRERLNDQSDIHLGTRKSGDFHGTMGTNYVPVDEELMRERFKQQRKQGALDLAVPHKTNVLTGSISNAPSERRGSGATLLLPDFTIIRGSMPLSAGQGIPESPEPESPHTTFEWDSPSPFGGPLFAPHWNQNWNNGRPSSLDETQSPSRKASQPELDIELAKKTRPTTLPSINNADHTSNSSEAERKRLGVILNPRDVNEVFERRFGLQVL